MSLQPGQELTPEEVLALKQDSAAANAAVFSATNMGRAMMQGAPEYTPEEIAQMKAAEAPAELTPEQILVNRVQRIYDPTAPDPTIEEWRFATKAEKALQESGEIDSNFVAAAKGIGGLVVTLADGATSALRYDPRDAEGNVIPAAGALDYISRYNPATMPAAMADAALRLPATLNYAGELMEQSYATLAAGARAMGGPKYRVAETGEFVVDEEGSAGGQFGQIDPRGVVERYRAKGLTLVPVTEQDREEFDFQQFLGNRARMRSIEQKRTEEVGAEPLTAAALSLGAAPLDAITGSNYMEQIWRDKLPAESQAMFMQAGADPMNWASLGAGATRLGISAAAKGAGAKFLTAIGKGAQAMSRPTEASIKQVKNFQNAVWPAGRVALYAGGLAGLNYSNLPEPLKNGMNVAAAAYVAYRGGGAVLRWTGKNFPTAGIMLRESADPLGGADKIARHMVANNPKIPAAIRERVARPSQFVSMESTPARLARNEALSPRTRALMDKLSNVYVVQGVRTASDLTTGAVKGGIIAAPFAEASRLAGDEKGADITYGAGLAFGAAGGLGNRIAGARNRRVAQAESDIGRMLVDIQAAGPELQKSGGLKRWQWFDRELNRFLTDVELAGGDIGHMFQTRSFDEIARTAAMQGLFRNVDYVPLNGDDFALNAKAAGNDGAAGFFLQAPEGGRPRIFVNLDARRADVEAHEFGEALFSSGAFSPEQMADMRAAIDKRYGPQGLEARAREYAEQMIKANNAREFPRNNLVVSETQIRSMMDNLSQAELQRGGTDAMDWIRREVMVEEWRMAGLDYAAIRRNVPQGANPLTFAENILGANARALGLSGVKIDPETGLAAKPDQLFKDNPVAADDPIVNRNLRQYIKAHQQWMNDPAHEVPSGVKIAPDGRAESLANNPNVIFDANGQNPLATRDPQTGQVRWKNDKDRAKDAKVRGQQIRNVAGRDLVAPGSPQFGPKKTANGRIRISGRRLPAALELQNHWKPQLEKIRRLEALADGNESTQVLYVAMGNSADKVKTSRPQDIVAINREMVFDEWVVQGKNNDLYGQFLDLTTIRNRAMKAIAARNPALDPANGGPGYSLKAVMDDVFQWMDDKRAGKAGEATIGQDRKNIVNALINPGTSMNKSKNPLAGSFGRGSAIKTLLVDNIMAVSGTGRKGVAMDYNWANGNFMPDQPAPRPDVDSDLNIPNNNRMPSALPQAGMAMPEAPANLTTDQILRELEENQGYLGLSTLGMREGRPVKGGAQQTRELLKRNTALNEELRRRGVQSEDAQLQRALAKRGQAMPDVDGSKQSGYDNTYLKQALAAGTNGKVRLTRPIKPNEALPLLSQVEPITERVDKDTFTYDRPALVELYKNGERAVAFKYDPDLLVRPNFKDVAVEHAGKQVQLAMADRQSAVGGDMGGVMNTYLKSLREVKITDPMTGRKLIAVWANNDWKPARAMKGKAAAGAKDLLTYLMGETAHGSNLRSVRRISNEIDNAPISAKEKNAFLIIANRGVKKARTREYNAAIAAAEIKASKLKERLSVADAKNKAEIRKQLNRVMRTLSDAKTKITKYKISAEEDEFAAVVRNYRSARTGYENGTATLDVFKTREEEFFKYLDGFKRVEYREKTKRGGEKKAYKYVPTDAFKKLQAAVRGKHMVTLDNTFDGRKAAVEDMLGLTVSGFNIDHILPETADFEGGRINHIVSSVELSTNPELGAAYLGDDPQQAKFMTPLEAAAAKKMKASGKFTIHEAYAWVMLGPEDGNHFLNNNPKTPEQYFPTFKQRYAETKTDPAKKATFLASSESNQVNTMRDQTLFPLVMPSK